MRVLNGLFLLNKVFAQDASSAESGSGDEQGFSSVQVTKVVHLDITVNGETLGTVDIGLFGDQVPKTTKNFESLCEGWKNPDDQQDYQYAGSKIHRISPEFVIQAGDIVNGDGTGSISIYGQTFDDENFLLKHYDEGWVSMANNGKDSNGSQFFILLDEADFLDGEHVVFGKVIYGME